MKSVPDRYFGGVMLMGSMSPTRSSGSSSTWASRHSFGTSENAVKSPIWIAVSVYVLVAIVKKRLALTASLYEILQILSLTLFEKTPVNGLFDSGRSHNILEQRPNQLNLFN